MCDAVLSEAALVCMVKHRKRDDLGFMSQCPNYCELGKYATEGENEGIYRQ